MPNPPGKPVEVGWICEVCPKGVPKAEVPNDGAAGVVEAPVEGVPNIPVDGLAPNIPPDVEPKGCVAGAC